MCPVQYNSRCLSISAEVCAWNHSQDSWLRMKRGNVAKHPVGDPWIYQVFLLHLNCIYKNYSLEFSCITQHQLLEKLLDKDILEIMLRTVWEVTRGNAEINPK
jgi:hypothetical protein